MTNTLRALWRAPGYTAVAFMMFVLGIGLTLFMFGAVKGYLLGALPFPDSGRLVHVSMTNQPGTSNVSFLPPRTLDELTRNQTSFTALGGYTIGTVNLSGDDRPERYSGALVVGALFEALGVAPLLGRTLTAADDRHGAPLVIVIGADLWRHRFNEDPQIVGHRTRVNGRDAEIVGVMPFGFEFPQREAVWVPHQQDIASLAIDGGTWVDVVGRLRPGVTQAHARAELQGLYARLRADAPRANLQSSLEVRGLRDAFIPDEARTIILTLFASVTLVLLIACANVANLTFARIASRRRELALRTCLGAGRMRLIGGILAEVTLVALAGAAVGLLLAEWGGAYTDRLLAASAQGPPYWVDMSTDWWLAGFAVAAALVSALVAGLLPAWRATRGDLNAGLRDGGIGTSDARQGRVSGVLVVVQITLCCVLLVNAGLMLRSAMNLNAADDGLGEHTVITGRIGLFESTHPDAAARWRTYERLEQELGALPGVRAAALTTSLPLAGSPLVRIRRADADYDTPIDAPNARWVAATPGFFDAFRVRIARGRGFTTADDASAPPVAVVNAAFAAREWPAQDPIGQRVQIRFPEGPFVTVIGVAADFALSGDDLRVPQPAVFVPLAQDPGRFVSLAATVDGDPMTFSNAVRDAMLRVDADTPIYWLRSFEEVTALTTFLNRFVASLFGIFATIALVLAAAGVYAVLATAVVGRTREIGVRRALGAQDRAIVRMLVGQGGRQYVIGMVIGLVGAIAFSRTLAQMHYGVTPFDPVTLVSVTAVLALAAFIATWAPARRALRVQPMVALRNE
jgi:putative ABC transport system permease protein